MSSRKFCFVHAADLHLDTPFQGVSRSVPGVAEVLRDASLNAFEELVELTLRVEAEFLLLSGDIYDGCARGVRAQLRLHDGLARLCQAGLEVFIIHGNHDPWGSWSKSWSWPSGVHVFHAQEVGSASVVREGVTLATIHGLSCDRKASANKSVLSGFAGAKGEGLQIGMLHTSGEGDPSHESCFPCTFSQLAATDIDYWALGHIHLRQVVRDHNPWIVFPGNLQGRSPKPSELGPKGAMVVQVADGRVEQVEFVPCDWARFVGVELDIAPFADIAMLHQALLLELDKLKREHEGRALVIVVTLSGRGELHRVLIAQGALDELLTDLQHETANEQPAVWWNRILLETAPLLDLEAISKRGDFSSELMQFVERLSCDQEKLEQFATECFEDVDKRRITKWLNSEGSDPLELLKKAQLLALTLLEDDGAR